MAIDGSINLGDPGNTGTASTPITLSATSLGSGVITGNVRLLEFTMPGGSLEGPLAFLPFTLSANGLAGEVGAGSSAVTLLPFTLAGDGLGGNVADGDAVLPGLTLAADTGVAGDARLLPFTLSATGVAGRLITGSIGLRALTLSATMVTDPFGVGAVTLAGFTAAGTGLAGRVGAGNAQVRPITLSATLQQTGVAAGAVTLNRFTLNGAMISGALADGDALLPPLTVGAGGTLLGDVINEGTGDATLAEFSVVGDLLPGAVAGGDAELRPLTLSGEGHDNALATGEIALELFTVEGTLEMGGVAGSAEVTLRLLEVDAEGVAGNVASAEITLPLLEVAADGAMQGLGTASIVLPLLTLDGTLVQTPLLPEAGASFVSVVLNTRNAAVSEYHGVNANSLCMFGGLVLAATESGIVALTGGSDLGESIEASIASGRGDLGSAQIKRVVTGYVGYRADGDLALTLIADGHHEYTYPVVPRRIEDQHATRVKIGRGLRGTYWEWKLANKAGADFALDHLTLTPEITSRRVV